MNAAGLFAVLVQEIEYVPRLASHLGYQWKRRQPQFVFLAGLGADLRHDGDGTGGNCVISQIEHLAVLLAVK
jgi:hypothetical protein